MHLDLKEEDVNLLDRDDRYGTVVGTYTILGMFPHITGKNKIYIFKCSVCTKDPYLFGLGVFSGRYSYLKGKACGCAKGFLYTEELNYKRIKRIVEAFGFKFLGFHGTYAGTCTKCTVSCPKHGSHSNSSINNIFGS